MYDVVFMLIFDAGDWSSICGWWLHHTDHLFPTKPSNKYLHHHSWTNHLCHLFAWLLWHHN